MGYFQVRYDSRVVNYDRRGFIRLATGGYVPFLSPESKMLPRNKLTIFLSKFRANVNLVLLS